MLVQVSLCCRTLRFSFSTDTLVWFATIAFWAKPVAIIIWWIKEALASVFELAFATLVMLSVFAPIVFNEDWQTRKRKAEVFAFIHSITPFSSSRLLSCQARVNMWLHDTAFFQSDGEVQRGSKRRKLLCDFPLMSEADGWSGNYSCDDYLNMSVMRACMECEKSVDFANVFAQFLVNKGISTAVQFCAKIAVVLEEDWSEDNFAFILITKRAIGDLYCGSCGMPMHCKNCRQCGMISQN